MHLEASGTLGMNRIFFLVFLVALGFAVPSTASADDALWRSHGIDFRVLDITDGASATLWSCGADASIAVSKDNGNHWEARDQTKDAGLFLLIRFRESFGYAVGTTGFVAFTNDGGQTWAHVAIPYRDVLSASFSDSSHGLLRTRAGVFQTSDGKTWNSLSEKYANYFKKFPYVLSVAALDAKHMAVHLSEPPPSGSGFLFTKDGGANWDFIQIPNSTITTLLVEGDQYWAIGTEVVHKDKPGGGYAIPLALYSGDGDKWEHSSSDIQMCHWEGCGGKCTHQGCLAASGLVLSIFQKDVSRIVFPSNPDFTLKWAIAGSTICFVGSQIECADTKIDPVADASKMSGPTPSADAQPIVKATSTSNVQCIVCGLQSIYVDAKANGRYTLKVALQIDKNGLVDGVAFQNAPSATLADNIRRSMMQWVFLPLLKDGIPVNVNLNTAVNVIAIQPR
jgi:hypothetical protein